MTAIERLLFAMIGLTGWFLVLCDDVGLPDARAETAKPPNRYIRQILHDIVASAAAGQEPSRLDGYDELETRLQALLSREIRSIPQTQAGLSRQDIRLALNSCRIVGTLTGPTGHLNARLSC